jgi:phosphoribosylanthranilate isomerase
MLKEIKICGIRKIEDVLFSTANGATALGFVAYPKSPRFISHHDLKKISAQIKNLVEIVGVFVEPQEKEIKDYISSGINTAQIHCRNSDFSTASRIRKNFPSLKIWVAIKNPDELSLLKFSPDAVVFDSFHPEKIGGAGILSDWKSAVEAKKLAGKTKFILAGGLSPENIEKAIKTVRPDGVDVSSGVEKTLALKDKNKIKKFIENAVKAFSSQ